MFNVIELDPNGIYDAYLRKSRADMELERLKKFDTLKQHEKFLKDRAKQLGIKIRHIYREVVSGESIQDRPEIQKLLKEIETGSIDGILVVEVERLTRGDAKDQGTVAQALKYSDTKVITLNKIYNPNSDEDEEYFEFGLFMSRREYKTINRRMQRGRMANVLDGKYCASEPPFGYRKVKLKQAKGFTLEPIPEEAEIVKEMFKKRADGMGHDIICNWLNTLDFKPKKSDVWTPSTIKGMLSNPIYLGKIRWNSNRTQKRLINGQIVKVRKRNKEDVILVEGLHEGIIDPNTFDIVQKIEPKKTSIKHGTDLQNPLATLVKCSDCGRSMQRRPYYDNKKQEPKMRRKYDIDKDKLRLLLREHKGEYSLRDIANKIDVSKNCVDHWFSATLDKFTLPYADKWEQLKELLNITTTEFDEAITTYEENTIEPHEDTLICPKAHCTNIGSNLSLVEAEVIRGLQEYVSTQKDLLATYNPAEEGDNVMVLSLSKDLEKYNKQLEKAYELVEQGIYTSEEFTKRTKVIKDRIGSTTKELSKYQSKLNKVHIEKLLPKIEKVIDSYYKVDSIEKKNKLLKSVISYIEYKKDKGGRGYENNFSIAIHPKF
ncbi:MAG: recombinase family protein [Bacilli bacterium]|nr:recombinase family protein [Bacilli bacterium]